MNGSPMDGLVVHGDYSGESATIIPHSGDQEGGITDR